jgi:hypothetical protein
VPPENEAQIKLACFFGDNVVDRCLVLWMRHSSLLPQG